MPQQGPQPGPTLAGAPHDGQSGLEPGLQVPGAPTPLGVWPVALGAVVPAEERGLVWPRAAGLATPPF